MFLLTEKDITKAWCETSPVLVSICCITYNQEAYIESAIQSFLSQKTKFKFEIIIGEDSSNDSTLCVVERYKSLFPNLIRIVTSEKNVGMNNNLLRVMHSAVGKYLAICEGDDYWIDPDKLSKQVSVLENDKNASICTHRAILDDGKKRTVGFDFGESVKQFSVDNVITTLGQFAPTSSYLLRRSIINLLPDWFKDASVGDLFIEIYALKNSHGVYLPDVMSAYRIAAENSWSVKNYKYETQKNVFMNLIGCLKLVAIDLPQKNNIINSRMAYIYLSIATSAVKSGVYCDFLDFTRFANDAAPSCLRKKQMFFMFFSRWPSFVRYVYYMYAFFRYHR